MFLQIKTNIKDKSGRLYKRGRTYEVSAEIGAELLASQCAVAIEPNVNTMAIDEKGKAKKAIPKSKSKAKAKKKEGE